MNIRTLLIALLFIFAVSNISFAGEADVLDVQVKKESEQTYTFIVTVKHADEGWDHYVNSWEVVLEDGTVLGKRVLWHPHDNEQPFTRSLTGVVIPKETKSVKVQAHDSVHGYGGDIKTLEIDLDAD